MDSNAFETSSIQRQFWLAEQLSEGTRAYQVPSRFLVHGTLDVVALQAALDAVVARHGALRTRFVERGGALLQEVVPGARCRITQEDLQALSESEQRTRFDAEAQRGFELSMAPLLRVSLFRTGPDEHVLTVTLHHIITDLASKTIFAEELSALYAAQLQGKSASDVHLPEPSDYAAYVQREQAYVASDGARKAKQLFEGALDRNAAPLGLLTDHPRPARFIPNGERVSFDFDATQSEAIARASEALTTKPFLLLLTAYAVVLSRSAGQEQVHVGVPFPNRHRDDQSTFGCFVNNLPLRVDLSADPTFEGALRDIRKSMLLYHRHQQLPLAELIGHLNPPREPDRSPLFQTGFTFEPPMDLQLEGAEVTSQKVHAGGSQMDLFLTLWEDGKRLRGQLEYATALWNADSAERIVSSLQTLVTAVTQETLDGNQSSPVSRLPLVSDAMAAQLEAWNATERDYPGPLLMHERLAAQAARTPDARAVVFGDLSLSYAELNERANGVAEALVGLGVRPGDAVGLYFERSLELVIALYGALKAGGAYMPLDPEYPEARMIAVVEDGRPKAVLHGDLPLPPTLGKLVALQVDAHGGPRVATAPAVSISPDEPAYIIFTSGSTGRPKGVANSHRGIHNRVCWMQETFGLTQDDVVLQKTPFTFDVSVWEFLWPLTEGATLAVAKPSAHRDPKALAHAIARHGVTVLHFVPSMLQLFLEHQATRSDQLATLKKVMASGEALPADLVTRYYSLLPGELHNLYGPTEAAVDVTWWACDSDRRRDPVPIGRPIANTQIHILDAHGQKTPIGVAGELHIGGVQVALGYKNRPDLTAERFIGDPFRSGGRLYRTGDLARYIADGTIEYLGRLDHQIKLRGLRIELGEIESVLLTHDHVQQTVVTAHTFPSGEQSLVAYVVTEGQPAEDLPQALRDHLSAHVPGYMVVSHVVVLDRFPLTSSGKVDRKLLPAPQIALASRESFVPGTRQEALLRRLWCDLLQLPSVGIHDNFFDLGGTSLLSARMLQHLRDECSVDLPLVAIFEHPTIESLAKHLARERSAATDRELDPLLKRARSRAALRLAALAPTN